MSLDFSWVGGRREGEASFVPVWLERRCFGLLTDPGISPAPRGLSTCRRPTRDNSVRAQASTGPPLLAGSWPSPGGAALLASLVVGLLVSPTRSGPSCCREQGQEVSGKTVRQPVAVPATVGGPYVAQAR